MAVSDDDVLARLGIHTARPFDWGAGPRMANTNDDVDGPKKSAVVSSAADAIAAPLPLPLPLPLPPPPSSSGLDMLWMFVRDESDGRHDRERGILRSLFRSAKVEPAAPSPRAPRRDAAAAWPGGAAVPPRDDDVSIKGLSDRAVAELSVEGRSSLFGSILRLFGAPRDGNKSDGGSGKKKGDDWAEGAVPNVVAVGDSMILKEPLLSTAEIVRSVHLSARPGDIPLGMDSKEYTMAALHFLSSRVPFLHEDEDEYRTRFDGQSKEGWDQLRETLPVLPLIKATNPGMSLELRRYGRMRPLIELGRKGRKRYPDSMDGDPEFRRKVLNLERIYSSSLPFSSPSTAAVRLRSEPSSSPPEATPNDDDVELPFTFQRYVPRRKLVPRIEGGAKEELTLMISGHMQQPQHTPGPKSRGGAKSKAPAGAAVAPAPGPDAIVAKSAPPPGADGTRTTSLADREGGGGDSCSAPKKRKGDATVYDDFVGQFKKGKEFHI